MKKLLFLLVIIAAFACKAQAQQKPEQYNVNQFVKHVGKKITMCEAVYSFKILSDTVTMLNMGGEYPNQRFTVVVTGKEVELNYDGLKGKHICVTGDTSMYKGRPEVLIYHPDQIQFN
jgi:DNA/RNA endonuclease YhcR with UshA esterase domain